MKLKSRNNNKTILIVCLAVVAALVIGAVVFMLVSSPAEEQDGKEIVNISVDILPKLTYYVGEEFDPSGARLQVITSDSANSYFINCPNKKVTFSGFDSSKAVDSQVVTVSYEGFTTTITVKIKEVEKPEDKPTLTSIEVCDMPTTYSRDKWNEGGPIIKNAYLKLTFSDGSVVGSYAETPLLYDYIGPYDTVEEGETVTYLTITYTVRGITQSTTVTITITE